MKTKTNFEINDLDPENELCKLVVSKKELNSHLHIIVSNNDSN